MLLPGMNTCIIQVLSLSLASLFRIDDDNDDRDTIRCPLHCINRTLVLAWRMLERARI